MIMDFEDSCYPLKNSDDDKITIISKCSRNPDIINPIFSVVSSCVGSPRRFIEDCQDYKIDYQTYLSQDNIKISHSFVSTPEVRISKSLENHFSGQKHTRTFSTPDLSNTIRSRKLS